MQDHEVTVNGDEYTNILPYVSEHVHVKKATSEFVAVTGFGFHILYDGAETVYITLEPFFMHKVSLNSV